MAPHLSLNAWNETLPLLKAVIVFLTDFKEPSVSPFISLLDTVLFLQATMYHKKQCALETLIHHIKNCNAKRQHLYIFSSSGRRK